MSIQGNASVLAWLFGLNDGSRYMSLLPSTLINSYAIIGVLSQSHWHFTFNKCDLQNKFLETATTSDMFLHSFSTLHMIYTLTSSLTHLPVIPLSRCQHIFLSSLAYTPTLSSTHLPVITSRGIPYLVINTSSPLC